MNDDALHDLSRLREIAEEGRRLPLLGGRYMILWGAAVALAATLHWAVVSGLINWPMMSLAAIWFGLTSAAGITTRLFARASNKRDSVVDLGNRIERNVWQAGGLSLGLISISIFAAALLHQSQSASTNLFLLFAMMPPISFAIYAIALRVAAEAAYLPALKPYAAIALVLVPLSILLIGSPWQMLLTAVGIIIVAILPGRLLLALEKAQPHG